MSGDVEQLTRPEIDAFLAEEVVGRVGCHADGLTYVVPVIFAYDGSSFYVHTVEGTKLRMIRANAEVCFEVDRYHGAAGWKSVIAQGTAEELDGDASDEALALLAARFATRAPRPRASNGTPSSSLRIRIREITGRRIVRPALAP